MITTALQGGLGNQMFQYAFGLAQAKRFNTTLTLDISAYGILPVRPYQLHQFRIPQHDMTHVRQQDRIIVEYGLPYNEKQVSIIRDGDTLRGYWQSEKYFESVREEVAQAFTPASNATEAESVIMHALMMPNTVAVHVRRGDYLQRQDFHGVLPLGYYAEAFNVLERKYGELHPVIFSDDIGWCKWAFKGFPSPIFRNPVQGREAVDIHLMSFAQHHIIANSSFSWWGAWLGEKDQGTIIAPRQWFTSPNVDARDIVPERWVKI